jgi:hypothetical protein
VEVAVPLTKVVVQSHGTSMNQPSAVTDLAGGVMLD